MLLTGATITITDKTPNNLIQKETKQIYLHQKHNTQETITFTWSQNKNTEGNKTKFITL